MCMLMYAYVCMCVCIYDNVSMRPGTVRSCKMCLSIGLGSSEGWPWHHSKRPVGGEQDRPRRGGEKYLNIFIIYGQVGASLDVFRRDAKLMRGDGPVVFAQAKHGAGVGEIVDYILQAWKKSQGQK